MIKKALCFLYNEEYKKQGDIALNSAKFHNSDYTTFHLTDNKNSSIADIALEPKDLCIASQNWIVTGRLYLAESILTNFNYDTCIFLDADTYTYSSYKSIQLELTNGHSIVVTPHITKPLPEDGLYPQNRTICLAGNYNAGIWGISKNGLNFLSWWKQQTDIYPNPVPEAGLASEQGWLRFACDFDDKSKIFKHPGYNVAYWNIMQRELQLKKNEWIIDNHELCMCHFSGLKEDTPPEQMSVFQNRYTLKNTDPAYIIYKQYHDLVWGQKYDQYRN